jgi:hypothetical protein
MNTKSKEEIMGQKKRMEEAGKGFDPATAPRFNVQVTYYNQCTEDFERVIVINVKDGMLIIADEFKTKVIRLESLESYEFSKVE